MCLEGWKGASEMCEFGVGFMVILLDGEHAGCILSLSQLKSYVFLSSTGHHYWKARPLHP